MRAPWAVALPLVLCACGGSVDGGGSDERRATETGGGPGAGSTGGASVDGGSSGFGGSSGGAAGEGASYSDPGCPDVPPPIAVSECDPFAANTGCSAGERCTPFVEYPATECQREIFGTMCVLAGSGVQGDDCTVEPCAEHHVCVTTGQGNQCARICDLRDGSDDCAPGLLCQPLDVNEFYICF